MSDAILSQEEIDALLSSMDKGEVDLDAAPQVESEAYDITSPHVDQKEDFDALGEVYEKFTRRFRNTLETHLQTGITLQLAHKSIVRYSDIIQAHPHPSGFGIFSMEPLVGKGLIIADPKLFFVLIDCMAGGTGRPPKSIRDFTPIEMGIMLRLFTHILKDLETAWQVVYATRISLEKVESNPDYLHIADNADLMQVKQYDITVNKSTASLYLCFPYLMLDAIRHELSSSFLQSKNTKQVYADQLKQVLHMTPVTVTAELGKSLQTVRDVLHLKQDDIITLDQGPQDQVIISVESVPKFQGIAGVTKGNRAIHIFGMVQ